MTNHFFATFSIYLFQGTIEPVQLRLGYWSGIYPDSPTTLARGQISSNNSV